MDKRLAYLSPHAEDQLEERLACLPEEIRSQVREELLDRVARYFRKPRKGSVAIVVKLEVWAKDPGVVQYLPSDLIAAICRFRQVDTVYLTRRSQNNARHYRVDRVLQ
jgi:septum formation topological specificity factor MinE